MIILGIETSCDETAISIIETSGKFPNDFNIEIKANLILSQIALHREYGGVFPMLAKREHSKNLVPLFKKALEKANLLESETQNIKPKNFELKNLKELFVHEPEILEIFKKEILNIKKPQIDAIAVTKGPGLEPALWTGINFAKALSTIWNIPLIPINHMEGHIFASLLQIKKNLKSEQTYKLCSPIFPAIALLVSGGHTELVFVENWLKYKILGATRDDAVGEAFDKVARILGLPYPGGPEISKLAEKYKKNENENYIKLPRPMINSKDYDFSFSGIKTAVLYAVKKLPELTYEIKSQIAQEFETAVIETIVSKTKKAIENKNCKSLIIGGGVSANKKLRSFMTNMAKELNISIFLPEISHSTDNALMISTVASIRLLTENLDERNNELCADGNWNIEKI